MVVINTEMEVVLYDHDHSMNYKTAIQTKTQVFLSTEKKRVNTSQVKLYKKIQNTFLAIIIETDRSVQFQIPVCKGLKLVTICSQFYLILLSV